MTDTELEHRCDWCDSPRCVAFDMCGGPTGPGIDEPHEEQR
mgnify:CR=1 FL=1